MAPGPNPTEYKEKCMKLFEIDLNIYCTTYMQATALSIQNFDLANSNQICNTGLYTYESV